MELRQQDLRQFFQTLDERSEILDQEVEEQNSQSQATQDIINRDSTSRSTVLLTGVAVSPEDVAFDDYNYSMIETYTQIKFQNSEPGQCNTLLIDPRLVLKDTCDLIFQHKPNPKLSIKQEQELLEIFRKCAINVNEEGGSLQSETKALMEMLNIDDPILSTQDAPDLTFNSSNTMTQSLDFKVARLYLEEGCSIKSLSRRFKLPSSRVKNFISKAKTEGQNPSINETPKSRRIPSCLHKFLISYLTDKTKFPSIEQLKNLLFKKFSIKVSRVWLTSLVKKELNLSYTKVYNLDPRSNLLKQKLLRQLSSKAFVEQLKSGKTIINIDESSLQQFNNSRMSWGYKGKKTFCARLIRINQVSIIAAVSNRGDVFFTVNSGRNNSQTLIQFVYKLCQRLDQENNDWREHTVIMLDNATYHRSKITISTLKALRVPLMFLGPYQFDLAPIEKLFAFVKKHLSFPDGQFDRLRARENLIIKVASMISKLNFSWVCKSFLTSLSHAPKYILMQDI